MPTMLEISKICKKTSACIDCIFIKDCPQEIIPEDWDIEHYQAKIKEDKLNSLTKM